MECEKKIRILFGIFICVVLSATNMHERDQPGMTFTLKTFERLLIENTMYFPGTLTLERALIFDYSTGTHVFSGLQK